MKTTEILQVLPYLTISDRLKIAEVALHLIQQEQQGLTKQQQRQQMAIAAMTAVSDYSTDKELTVFTELDGEDFYDEIVADTKSVNPNAQR
jgi:hypothetical protein